MKLYRHLVKKIMAEIKDTPELIAIWKEEFEALEKTKL